MHGGNKQIESQEITSLRNYQLSRFKAKLERHAESPNIKSLRDEVAILRMMLESKLDQCGDVTDLILQSGPISDMVLKIDKVVNSCHKLEGSMGQLIDKTAILQLAQEFIAIVTGTIGDATIEKELKSTMIDKIADQILESVGRVGKKEDDE